MGILSWIAMGLIVYSCKINYAALDPGGIIITILIGIAGAFLGSISGLFWELKP